MKKDCILILLFIIAFFGCQVKEQTGKAKKIISFVDNTIGSSNGGRVIPAAAVPNGMVQLGPDTRSKGSGYEYNDTTFLGFSHVHKSGGGCNDFLDILFFPANGTPILTPGPKDKPNEWTRGKMNKKSEKSSPGYYEVTLQEDSIQVGLTVTPRTGFHRYRYASADSAGLLIDLKHGSRYACTIVREENKDTVVTSFLHQLDERTIVGSRVSSGWAEEQHIYFAAKFSHPFSATDFYLNDRLQKTTDSIVGTNVKGRLLFDLDDKKEVLIKVGVSPVSIQGALKNLEEEIPHWNFEQIKKEAEALWEASLSKIKVETNTREEKELFYSLLYNVLLYPMLYSDVDGQFRGADHQVHQAIGGAFYGGSSGLWDVFRAANPLLTIINPEMANNHINTFLSHYQVMDQLPIFLLAGNETLTMIGNHSMPIIADTYFKGIRNYDEELLFSAMKKTSQKEVFGFSMQRPMGTMNYRKYGYVPADLEYESVAITLELAYDDWCVAQTAKMLGKKDDYSYYLQQSENYKNVFDTLTGFARGRFKDGSWRTPFDPLFSNHRKDDYCEGNAWQWSFFVPHDVDGLAEVMGGKDSLDSRLDQLFKLNNGVSGTNRSGDITGLIGQYAHGNEPSHHIAYLYNWAGKPWKTQKTVREIMSSKYNNSPQGICGNEDTGQMSAWYIWSSLGFYPVTHGDGKYIIGSPSISYAKILHPLRGEDHWLEIISHDQNDLNIYIQKVLLNGEEYTQYWLNHYDLFNGQNTLEFYMGNEPNYEWGI